MLDWFFYLFCLIICFAALCVAFILIHSPAVDFSWKFQFGPTGANSKAPRVSVHHHCALYMLQWCLLIMRSSHLNTMSMCWQVIVNAIHCLKKLLLPGAARTSPFQLMCSALCIVVWCVFFYFLHVTLCCTYLVSSKFIIIMSINGARWKRERREIRDTIISPPYRLDTFFLLFATKNSMQNCASLMESGCFFFFFRKKNKLCPFFHVRFILNTSAICQMDTCINFNVYHRPIHWLAANVYWKLKLQYSIHRSNRFAYCYASCCNYTIYTVCSVLTASVFFPSSPELNVNSSASWTNAIFNLFTSFNYQPKNVHFWQGARERERVIYGKEASIQCQI